MTSQMITYVQKKILGVKSIPRHTVHNTFIMGNKSNYLIIIHHLRSFENYAFVNDVHKFFSFCSQGRTGHENRVDGGKNSGESPGFFSILL